MEVIVIYYDGNTTLAKKCRIMDPESVNGLDFGLSADDMITAVISGPGVNNVGVHIEGCIVEDL